MQRGRGGLTADTCKVQPEPVSGRRFGETNEKKIPELLKNNPEPLNKGSKSMRFCVSRGRRCIAAPKSTGVPVLMLRAARNDDIEQNKVMYCISETLLFSMAEIKWVIA